MRLDIVIPAFNEQHRIGRTLETYCSALDDRDIRFVVALDGCSDGTAEIVRQKQEGDARVSLHEFPKLGKGGVILESFRRAGGELVAFVDADAATPPRELTQLAEVVLRHGVDGAIASRYHPASFLPRRRPLGRRVASGTYARLVRTMFGLPYRDTQCGAKVLRREAVERIVPYVSSRDLVFDVDLLLVARELGLAVVEVPTIWIDRDGSRIDAVADSKRMAASLLRLWLQHRLAPAAPAEPASSESSPSRVPVGA